MVFINVNELLMKNCSLFNSFSIISQSIMEPTQCTFFMKGFPRVSKVPYEALGFGRIIMTNKKNRQTNNFPS
jgi:hypothetical protein